MKSGLIHWVGEATAERLRAQLKMQQGHTFVQIAELAITINTSEIEGVYGLEEYDSMTKLKQGLWQCAHKRWHEKKVQCSCARDIARQRDADVRRQQMARPDLTLEQQAERGKTIKSIGDELRSRGVLPQKME